MHPSHPDSGPFQPRPVPKLGPAGIDERTAPLEIRLRLQHANRLRGGRQHLTAEAPTRWRKHQLPPIRSVSERNAFNVTTVLEIVPHREAHANERKRIAGSDAKRHGLAAVATQFRCVAPQTLPLNADGGEPPKADPAGLDTE